MPQDTDVIRNYFAKLGLEPEIADLYLALNAYGPQSISEVSRRANVERTRVYRLLDIMADLHLSETEIHYKRSIVKAAPVGNLQLLIDKREHEIKELRQEFGEVEKVVTDQAAVVSPATHVQFYKGDAGLKQMLWNETRAQTENLSILYESMQTYTRRVFFERWAHRCNERNLQFRSIIGDRFQTSIRDWYDVHDNERLNNWHARYIPDSVFHITHSMVVYNDVIAYYNWKEGEIFGIEVHNQELADSQRYFFEMLWQQGGSSSTKSN